MLVAITTLALLSAPAVAAASAEPYLAVRTGLKCSQCHANVTGGGNRTTFGSVFAQTVLPARRGTFVDKSVTDFLNVGFDFRVEGTGTFRTSSPRTAMGIQAAQVYLEAQFLNNRLVLYVDERVGPDRAEAREAFAMVRRLPLEGYAKAGKFLPPFGTRIQDDAEFIRSRTAFNFGTPDQGIELGIEPGPITASVALTNGTFGEPPADSDKMVTGSAAVVFRQFRFGASASHNRGRDTFAAFGGVGSGRLALLGEVGEIRDAGRTQRVAWAEANWLARDGLNARITYGLHDPDTEGPEPLAHRMRFGLEVFPVQFVRLSAFYVLLKDDLSAPADLDRMTVQLHIHF